MLKNLVNSTAKLVIVILVFALLVFLNIYVWKKDRRQEQEIIDLQKELSIQQTENEKIAQINRDLRQKIDSLKQGSKEMIEEEARNGFGMVGEGETFFHLEEPEK
ncbi:MAG: cell division protein FtsB [Gammaproteobacteria bacterium]|nr:MAG: cell division protein FtsB [Gammaproteobacteria bacterium]